MGNNNDQDWIVQKLGGELDRLDDQFADIGMPSLQELEHLAVVTAVRRCKKARNELLLFWLISLLLLACMVGVLYSAPGIYLLIQILIPLLGLGGLAAGRIRRSKEGAEE
ncbi:DUF5345 family protein [Paenibacillus donghaensis]|uniref:YxlC family protein n=1 Tax=Paenibacillus donghaensis TaxID=414771 RepID=A0A2Z2KRQ3_9BACL|nr:DUF5345 family protein [Paenibacillus donghaensis]ASA24152.1 hypothetical protein B9T62_27315 [Paenibacillus donghaensis]